MHRILVVLRGELDTQALGRCDSDVADDDEMAICYVLPGPRLALGNVLRAQQEVTAQLRRALGGRAENIAVFVAAQDGVDACAKEWGATVVRA